MNSELAGLVEKLGEHGLAYAYWWLLTDRLMQVMWMGVLIFLLVQAGRGIVTAYKDGRFP